jgi:hypothetical protein
VALHQGSEGGLVAPIKEVPQQVPVGQLARRIFP